MFSADLPPSDPNRWRSNGVRDTEDEGPSDHPSSEQGPTQTADGPDDHPSDYI